MRKYNEDGMRHRGKRPERLYVYWTAEARKKDALMEFPYRQRLVEEAGQHFDGLIQKIQAKDFRVSTPPGPGICKECDLRFYCAHEGTIAVKSWE